MQNTTIIVEPQIAGVIERLEKQSNLEKSHGVDVAPEDRMLAITRDTGLFYNILLRSSGIRRVLEIGLSTGYSTLWFADAVLESMGEITTIEQNPSKIRRARKNFEDAGVADMITTVHGAALDVLQELRRSGAKFDFAFIDADKENCRRYFDLVFPMLSVNGIVGTDNMRHPEKYREEMKRFSDHVRSYPNAKTTTLEIGNGQELTVKTR